MWALAWDCQQLLAILRGDFARLATFFDANIFHPLPLTLAYSEHFIAQAVQVLPVWALTGNPILCYNLLYLSTFVLSGLGAYLVRARAHRQSARRVCRRRALRVRPLPVSTKLASAGAVVAVDAVRAVRIPQVLRLTRCTDIARRTMAAAAWRSLSAHRAEPVLHLLPDVLRAIRRRVCRLGDLAPPSVVAHTDLDSTRDRRGARCGVDHTAPAAVRTGAGAAADRAQPWRAVDVCRRRLFVRDRGERADPVGLDRAGLSQSRR